MYMSMYIGSLGTNSLMFENCLVFCDVRHVRSSILGQNELFEKFDVQTIVVSEQGIPREEKIFARKILREEKDAFLAKKNLKIYRSKI